MFYAIFSPSDLQNLSNQLAPNLAGDTVGQIIYEVFTTYFLPGAGLVMFIYLILGGFEYIASAANPKATASAKAKITNAVIGFVLIFAAYWIVQIISIILGLSSAREIF